MMHNQTKKYIDQLQEFVQSLNSLPFLNSLGGKRPKDVGYENQNGSIRGSAGEVQGKEE